MLPKFLTSGSIFTILFLVIVGLLYTTESKAQCTSTIFYSSYSIQNLKCQGDNSGSISITTVGGIPSPSNSYTYSLFSSVINPSIVNSQIGNYTFTNLPANGNYLLIVNIPSGPNTFERCVYFLEITEPPALAISGNVTDATCSGKNDGAINATVSGGASGPYSYSWSNGAITEDLSGIAAGSYTLTITDGNGCIKSQTFTVAQPTTLTSSQSISNITCNGKTDGTINVSASGGTAPYSYKWENNSTSSNRIGLTAGNYSVTITDANNCTITIPFILTEPTAITNTQSVTNVSCNGGANGTISIPSVSGGTAPYTYLWLDDNSTIANRTGLIAGSYSVTIEDANSCTLTVPFTITEPAPITSTQTTTNVTCNSGNDGTITITNVLGGVGPYTYLWENNSTAANRTGLAAGSYNVTITDVNNCQVSVPFTITEPAALAVTQSISNITCNGASNGSITITGVSGGVGPYTYLWDDGSTSFTRSGLAQGTYTVTVTDANSCSKAFSFPITQPIPFSTTQNVTNVSCNAGTNGAITLTGVSGGVGPYTYKWDDNSTGSGRTGLAAGTYSVDITDANFCTTTVPFTITEPLPITATSTVTNITCNGASSGSIAITGVSGGTGPYSYKWDDNSTGPGRTGLAAGPYFVTITDANSCTSTVPFTITESPAFAVTQTSTHVTCNAGSNGAISITGVSGGVGPYTYMWDDNSTGAGRTGLIAGTYTVVITDANACSKSYSYPITEPTAIIISTSSTPISCNGLTNGSITTSTTGGVGPYSYVWNTGQTTASITNLGANTYQLTVTDNNSCQNSVTVTITNGPAVTGTATATPPTICVGTTSVINASFGIGFTPASSGYSFNNGASYQSSPSYVTPAIYADTTISVILKDINGCLSTTIPVSVATVKINATVTQTKSVSCNGGTTGELTVNVAGNPSGYSYSINGGSTYQTSNVFPNLAAGSYTIIIDDGTACKSSYIGTVTQPAALTITVKTIVNVTLCPGNNNGSILVSTNGGNAGKTFTLNPGAIIQTDSLFTSLPAGPYTIDIEDSKGCSASVNASITEPAGVDTTGIIRSITNISCNGGSNGSINLSNITGGTAPYSYSLNGAAAISSPVFTNLIAGNYAISITDANSCSKTIHSTITEPAPISISGTPTPLSCNGVNDGAISPVITGGSSTGTPSYAWNTGQTIKNISNLSPNTYKLVYTDGNGCKDSAIFVINNGTPITGTAIPSASGICSGTIVTVTADLDAPYTPAANAYSFNNGISYQAIKTFSVAVTADTTILVILKDVNGCLTDTMAVDIATKKLNATVTQTKAVACNGGADGELTISVVGTTTGFTYSINGGTFQSSPVFTGLVAGNYTITVNDGTACNSTYTGVVTQPAPLTLTVKTFSDVTPCLGGSNGSIQVSTNGGNTGKIFTLNPGTLVQQDSLFSGLKAGTYTISVSDSKGCSATPVSETIKQPAGIDTMAIVDDPKNVDCAGRSEGTIKLTNVTGGAAPYTYTLNGISNKTSAFNTLYAGSYTMIITDANNCSSSHSFTITEPAPILYAINTTPPVCTNLNGSIEFINVTGGTPSSTPPGYRFSIDDGTTYVNTILFNNLAPATYPVRVIDAKGCNVGYDVILKKKQGPIPYLLVTQPSCYGLKNGGIVVDSLSGGLPYSEYKFDTATHTNSKGFAYSTIYSDLYSGTYALTIRDVECTYVVDSFYLYNRSTQQYDTVSSQNILVPEAPKITADAVSVDADRSSQTGVAGFYNFQGGTPTYLWSTDSINYNPIKNNIVLLNNLGRGTHSIYVQDSLGCSARFEITIHVEFFIPNLISPNNDGKNDRFEIMALPRGSELKIVNRWGNQIYLNPNYDNSWDGDELADGIYYYELSLPDGKRHKGWVEMIR